MVKVARLQHCTLTQGNRLPPSSLCAAAIGLPVTFCQK